MTASPIQKSGSTDGPTLKRELKVIDAAAFSVGLIGPVGGMALLGAGAVAIIGRAAIWAFVFALVAVALTAYSFTRLARYIAHSGSVYALVGITLGPRAGFVAGWALLGAYIAICSGSTIEIGYFFSQVLGDVGLSSTTPWLLIAIIALALVVALGFTEIHVITRILLYAEFVGVVLVTFLSIVVLVRQGIGKAPGNVHLTWDIFKFPAGTTFSTVAGAAVFGFTAFAGFEGAATLGEETQNPKREIPRAIKIAIGVVGVFFLLTMATQSLGYGTDQAGVDRFTTQANPYGNIGLAYVGKWLAVCLNLVASLSLFAITLGTIAASARILFALVRDAGQTRGIGKVSRKGAPLNSLFVVVGVVLVIVLFQQIKGNAVLNATFYSLTVGTIALLVAYILATLGAAKFLFFEREKRAPAWQVIIPILAVITLGYTIYKNWYGVAAPYSYFPYFVIVWLLIGLLIVMAVPGLAGRVRSRLAAGDNSDEAFIP
ncbi:amino acid transporter [Nakamurella sp. UYEF19]|uniref:APC family permease n=1 Tax=Nakamurella sp. UYEF19 TaxID=1756392 RepID=UPI0033925D9C